MGRETGRCAGHCGQRHRHRGGAAASAHHTPTLGWPEAFIQAQEGLFDAGGNIGLDSRKFLQDWMDSYVAWVKKHTV